MNCRRSCLVALRLALAGLAAGFGAASPVAFGQTPAAQPTLDQQDFAKANDAFEQGKFEEARSLFASIAQNYPTSPLIPPAALRLGYVYFRLNDYDRAVESLQKVPTLKNVTPDLSELALSLSPQVLSAKASSMKPDAPARKTTFEEAVKQYDAFLLKFPASEEGESAYYGKAVAQYQLGRYEDAALALRTNLTKFSKSENVLDSEYLLALTLGTISNVAAEKGTTKDASIETGYSNAEKLLNDVINKRTDVALANDARNQIGEIQFARSGFIVVREGNKADEARKVAALTSALEAYRQILPKELVIQAQKARIEQIKARREQALRVQHDFALTKRLGRVVDKEQEKLSIIEARPEQTLTAKIRMGQIFLQLDRLDEARVVLEFANGFVKDEEEKKQISYYLALSLASQNAIAGAANPALAERTEAVYNEFHTAHARDPLGDNLALVVGVGFAEKDPQKAIKYFQESSTDYPKGRFRMTVLAQEAAAMVRLSQYDGALKTFQETLAQKPSRDIAAAADFGIATIYQKTGKVAEALAAFKKVRETYPGLEQAEQATFWFGQMTYEKGDAKNAVPELQGFVKKFPASSLLANALFYLGQAQAGAGQRGDALNTYKELATKYPKSEVAPFSYFLRANLLREDNKLEDVQAVMRDFTTGYPDSVQLYQAYDFLAQLQSSGGKDADAITTYEKFVSVRPADPASAQALLRVATLHRTAAGKIGRFVALNDEQKKEWMQQVDASIKASEKAIADFPDSPQVALHLQNLLDCQKLRQGARVILEADIQTYFQGLADKFKDQPATRSKIIFALASITFDKDKDKSSQLMGGVYDASLRYSPSDLDLYGSALIEQKKLDEALKVYQKLSADYPIPPNTEPNKASREVQEAQAITLFGTGKVLQEQKKNDEAKVNFDKLEKLYGWSPKMLEANYGIALSLYQQKSYEDALKRLVGVVKANTAPAELRAKAMLLLARVHEDQGNTDTAIDNYVKINSYYSGVPTVAAEGLWRGANLLERQAKGELPMPKPATPAPKVAAKPGASPAAKPGGSPAAKPGVVPAGAPKTAAQ